MSQRPRLLKQRKGEKDLCSSGRIFHKKRAKSRALISSANMLIWCGKDRSLTFKQSLDFRSRSYELQSKHAHPFLWKHSHFMRGITPQRRGCFPTRIKQRPLPDTEIVSPARMESVAGLQQPLSSFSPSFSSIIIIIVVWRERGREGESEQCARWWAAAARETLS